MRVATAADTAMRAGRTGPTDEGSAPLASSQQRAAPTEGGATSSVYWRIRQKILRNEIAPDSHVNINLLARELDVSSTPVREALKQLQGDNLVSQEPGRGYRTTPLLDRDELRAMFEFRLLVEPWAAKVAAQSRLSNPGHQLLRQIAELDVLIEGHPDVRYELVEHDARFHDTILASIDNAVLRTAYSQTHCHLHAFRLYPSDHTGEVTITEHRKIADAIRAGEAEGAEAAMRAHLVTAYLRFSEGHEGQSEAMLPGMHPDRPAPNDDLAI